MTGPILRVHDVHLRRGSRPVLAGVSLEVGRGEVLALMGPSGSGKTTVLRMLAGLEPFDRGRVELDGVAIEAGASRAATLRALRRKVGMVFQFHCLFEHLSVLQNVSLALTHVQRMPVEDAERRAREWLSVLGVEGRAAALPRELSGGEAQRVAIARALAMDPPVLLLDEPTASLDSGRRNELVALLASLADRRRTLVLATHDEDFARAVATRVMRVADGRVG